MTCHDVAQWDWPQANAVPSLTFEFVMQCDLPHLMNILKNGLCMTFLKKLTPPPKKKKNTKKPHTQ